MRALNKLTKLKIDAAEPSDRLADGGGLILWIKESGRHFWRVRFRVGDDERMLSVGTYPDVKLKAARQALATIREQLAAGEDPSALRQQAKAAKADSFEKVAAKWFETEKGALAETTAERNQFLIGKLNDRIGKKPVSSLDTLTVSTAVKAIQKKHGPETARRALGIVSRVFGYALAEGLAKQDVTAGLKAVLKKRTKGHRASIIDGKKVQEQRGAIGDLLRKIDSFAGQVTTKAYLKLLALSFVRPTELRLGQWDEIDFEAGEWEIPAKRMKASSRKKPEPHIIPLSLQSIAILEDLKELTGGEGYIFPTLDSSKSISENAGINALRKVGVTSDRHSCHGFRAMARTVLAEQLNFPVDWIEHQLGHLVRDANGVAYNRTSFLDQRKDMMQTWASFLDECRKDDSKKVIPIKAAS